MVRWPKPIKFTDGRKRSTMRFNVSSLGEAEARRQAWLYSMHAYGQVAVRLSPFRAGVPNDFGPVSEVADERGLVDHGRERKTFSTYSDPPPATKRFPVVSWDPREDTSMPAENFCGNYEVVAYQADRVVYRCKGHPSRELLEDRWLRRRGTLRHPAGPGAVDALASPAGRDSDYDPDARGSADPPPQREPGDRPGDWVVAFLLSLMGATPRWSCFHRYLRRPVSRRV